MAAGEAVTSHLDIYRAANELIHQYGEEAAIRAAMRADSLAEKGDLDGYAVWRRILTAIDEILADANAPSRHVH
jgi:hypothetical protein